MPPRARQPPLCLSHAFVLVWVVTGLCQSFLPSSRGPRPGGRCTEASRLPSPAPPSPHREPSLAVSSLTTGLSLQDPSSLSHHGGLL